jgi:hypothetical protein
MRGIDSEQKFQEIYNEIYGVDFTCTFADNTNGQNKQENPSITEELATTEPETTFTFTCHYSQNSGSTCDFRGTDGYRVCYCISPTTPAPTPEPKDDCFGEITFWNFFYKWFFCLISKIFNLLF